MSAAPDARVPRLERRQFLRSAAATLAVGALGEARSARATQPRGAARIRVGYQIYSWGRGFPGAWWKGAAAVASLGFKGIEGEYTIAELYEGREEEFAEGMRRLGLTLSALYSTTDLERSPERYENVRKNLYAAAFARRHGARTLVIGGTEARHKDDALYTRYADAANELGRRTLEEHGVRCAVHPHIGSLVETREEIAKVMQRTDPRYLFLAPDTGHLAGAGCDPVEVFRSYQDRIVHAHLKDFSPPARPGARGSFVVLGKGTVDFPALLRILGGTSFDGWLDVELDRAADPVAAAVEAKQYLVGRLGLDLARSAA